MTWNRVVLGAALAVAVLGLGVVALDGDGPLACEVLRDHERAGAEAPQRWDDIYTLQADIAERMATRHELRTACG